MNNLIKNELKKVFKKKTLYIILFIVIGMTVMAGFFDTKEDYSYYSKSSQKWNKDDLEMYKENDSNNSEIVSLEAYFEAVKIAEKYESDSWQRYIIQYKLEPAIKGIKNSSDEEMKTIYQDEYNDIMKKIEAGDWKVFAKEELEEINSQIEVLTDTETVEYSKIDKQALEIRLEKDIPYGTSDLIQYVDYWKEAKKIVYMLNQKKSLTDEDKISKRNAEELIAVSEYAINNKINTGITLSYETRRLFSDNAAINLAGMIDDYGLFIVLTVCIIAGTIVSEEFNKGTIKLLLVRPYSRTKILISKLIASLIVMCISIAALVVIQGLIGGIIYGFNTYSTPIVMFDGSKLIELGLAKALLLNIACYLPQFILILVLSFTISTVLKNTPLAIILTLGLIMFEELINGAAYKIEKAKFLIYFFVPNWNLTQYLYGQTPAREEMSVGFSIGICAIYVVVMLIISMISFKKNDIKNI